MKLVQLLAKELKEWPVKEGEYNKESDYCVQSDQTSQVFFCGPHGKIFLSERADETSGVRVTRSEWQAEREKMNKPKWIRHRGGWMPVGAATIVEVRLRCGDIQKHEACEFLWRHKDCDSAVNIMAYRVIEETKDQEIEEVKDANIGTLSITLDANDVFKPMIASMKDMALEWGQIESPLKWRDAIIHCQAIIEDCEREIERNINLLDAEGLMMQKDSKKAMQHYAPDVDMSDWRNWQAGDIVECINHKGWVDISEGSQYVLNNKDFFSFVDDDGENRSFNLEDMNQENVGSDFKFIRRQ